MTAAKRFLTVRCIVIVCDQELLNLRPAEGELVVSSFGISSAYFKYDSSAFSIASDGLITFKTGDIYERKEDGHFAWMGRKHDYIQVFFFPC